ncbi:MAG: bile acid:sodium symporter, partial [Methanomassiliicoccaceae archaeon]|nr:bile acid:sodium symporter [Methanomassiliicoccaceae archaeon]
MPLMNAVLDVRWYIVIGLIAALAIGDTGYAPEIAMITLMVMMCVSLQGLSFSRSDIRENKKELMIGIIICYAVAGGVTLLVGSFYDHDLWMGWVMIAAVPCAISVTSGTLILRGNTKLAMITVTVIYVIALAATPVITKVFIGQAVSPYEVLRYVALFIVIPFAVSIPLRKMIIPADLRTVSINIMFFILVVVTFGANKEFILSEPRTVMWVICGCLVRIAAVAAMMEFILRKMRTKRESRIPMVLLSIWKNSALAMSMTMVLISTTESVLPSALSLPLEMLWFMGMIWYYGKRCPPV